MNVLKKFVLGILAIGAVLYLLFAFGTWHFNPGMWSEQARVMCGIIFGAITFVGGAALFAIFHS